MYLIKKYANRKLYDTTDKKYITMSRLSDIIKSGKDVSIVDNNTGVDLTPAIVSNLIAKDNGAKDKTISSSVLFQLVRKGGDALTDYTKRHFALWHGAFSLAEDEIDKLLKKLVKNKEISKLEGKRLKEEIVGFTDSLKIWIKNTIDNQIKEILDAMNLTSKNQFTTLHTKISYLEQKLKRLEELEKINSKK